MLQQVLDRVLTERNARSFAKKCGLAAFLFVFSFAFLLFYFVENDPWLVVGKAFAVALFAFVAAFYGAFFSVIVRSRRDGEEQRSVDTGTAPSGVKDSSEAEAETSE